MGDEQSDDRAPAGQAQDSVAMLAARIGRLHGRGRASVGLLGPRTRGQSLEEISGDRDAADAQALEGSAAALPTLVSAQSK